MVANLVTTITGTHRAGALRCEKEPVSGLRRKAL
jgi:hypothetical protein